MCNLFLSLMKATEYKKHFLEFISQVYPDGVPDGDAIIAIACDSVTYRFVVDAEDLRQFKTVKKKSNEPPKLKLKESDLELLKKMRITVPDGD